MPAATCDRRPDPAPATCPRPSNALNPTPPATTAPTPLNPASPDHTYDYYDNENWQVLEERKDGSSNPYAQYVWDPRYIDAPVVRFRDANTDGTLDDTLYYCEDANMNVTALVNPSGHVVERYVYDSYGQVTFLKGAYDLSDTATGDDWGAGTGSSIADNQILFGGYRFDPESGLYHVRNRPYHPTLGAWPVRDPAEYVDGYSLYQGFGANPINYLDPNGLQSVDPQPGPPNSPRPTYAPHTQLFIAEGDRFLTGVGLLHKTGWEWTKYRHYDIELWRAPCDKIPKLRAVGNTQTWQSQGMTRLKTVELEPDFNWGVPVGRVRGVKVYEHIGIGVVTYNDGQADAAANIYGDPPDNTEVEKKWNELTQQAKNYGFGEQQGYGGKLQHWPNSEFTFFGNNSSTFVWTILSAAGLPTSVLPGLHGGNPAPVPNTRAVNPLPVQGMGGWWGMFSPVR